MYVYGKSPNFGFELSAVFGFSNDIRSTCLVARKKQMRGRGPQTGWEISRSSGMIGAWFCSHIVHCKTIWVWNGTGPPEDMGKWITWILADVFCGWTCLQSHCLFDCQHHVSIRWPLISADWEGLVNRHNSNWTSWFPEICPAGQAINVHVYPSKPEGVFVPEGWQCLDCQVLLVHRCRWLALWLTQLKVQKSMNIDWCWK